MKILTAMALILTLTPSISANDHSADYKMGTFVSAHATEDGTLTSTIRGDGTTVAGSVYANHVIVYEIDVADGQWFLETWTQATDSWVRNMGETPTHFKSEKANPLDALKSGDKVLFRMEQHKKLLGTETDILIPFADNPNKEFRFVGTFIKPSQPAQGPQKPTDNVKAMCESHKLSPELEKQFCATPAPETPAPATATTAAATKPDVDTPAPTALNPADQMATFKRMCDSGMFKKAPPTNIPLAAQQAMRQYNQQTQQQCDLAFPLAKN